MILAQKYNKMSENSVLGVQKHLKQILKDPIQQCGHLFVEVQQYTASLNPSEVPSASLLGDDHCHLGCRVCAPP